MFFCCFAMQKLISEFCCFALFFDLFIYIVFWVCLLWIWYDFSSVLIDKISNNVDKLMHGKVAQHASVRRKRVGSSHSAIDTTSFNVETSSSGVHVSPTSSSRRYDSPHVVPNAPEVQHVVVVPDVYPGCPFDNSLLCLYANHIARHVWVGEIK